MVNEELVNWIKSEEAQGYSEKALTKILTKQNYSNKDIQEAFNSLKKENNKTPFFNFICFTIWFWISFSNINCNNTFNSNFFCWNDLRIYFINTSRNRN